MSVSSMCLNNLFLESKDSPTNWAFQSVLIIVGLFFLDLAEVDGLALAAAAVRMAVYVDDSSFLGGFCLPISLSESSCFKKFKIDSAVFGFIVRAWTRVNRDTIYWFTPTQILTSFSQTLSWSDTYSISIFSSSSSSSWIRQTRQFPNSDSGLNPALSMLVLCFLLCSWFFHCLWFLENFLTNDAIKVIEFI